MDNDLKLQIEVKRILQFLIEIVLIVGLVYYFYKHGGEFRRVLNVSVADIAWLLGLGVVSILVRSGQLKQLIYTLGSRILYWQSVWFTAGCTLLNYLPMNIGTIVKARGLKKYSGVRYARFVSLSSTDILLTTIASAAVGLVLVALPVSRGIVGPERWYVVIVFLIMLISAGLAFHIPSSWIAEDKGLIWHTLRDYLSGVEMIKKNPKDLAVLFILVITRLMLMAVQFLICFYALGTEISLIESLFYVIATSLLMIVSITPAGLGVREILIGALASFTGHGFDVGVLAAGLYRVCAMIIHISIGMPGLIILRANKLV